jgi:FixJ family two-component response regulator
MNALPPIVRVVDDDASWRQSVERLLLAAGYKTALYDSAESFLDGSLDDAPGCILLDVRMPGLDGLQLQQRLAESTQRLPIIFLSGHADIPLTVQAVKAGAHDLLTKPVASEVLLNAVAMAIAQDIECREACARLEEQRSLVRGLTLTERKVFDLVVRGKLNKQIGGQLGITERTVKWHRHNIMLKLKVASVAGLVSLAEHLDMVSGDTSTGAGTR